MIAEMACSLTYSVVKDLGTRLRAVLSGRLLQADSLAKSVTNFFRKNLISPASGPLGSARHLTARNPQCVTNTG